MNKLIIMEYVKRITKKDITNYAYDQNISLDNVEIDIIYDYIKNDINRILSNPEVILNEIKEKVSNNTYLKIMELYNKYKYLISSNFIN